VHTVSSPVTPPSSRRQRCATVVAAVVVAVLVAAVAYLVYAHRSITAAGTVTITENVIGSRTCLGENDDDLRKGTAVVIRAPSNQIIAVGELDEGVGGHLIAGNAQTCRFTFAVSGVPRERFYRIAVGGRPPVVFTYRQVAGRTVTLPSH
jgi:hypothetical protein